MDVVVTVPKQQWSAWIAEGDPPGSRWSGLTSFFSVANAPKITPGERVYVVSHGKLRGYAPLVALVDQRDGKGYYLIRQGNAVAVTIDVPVKGFQGFRYRWWAREDERPFPDWQKP